MEDELNKLKQELKGVKQIIEEMEQGQPFAFQYHDRRRCELEYLIEEKENENI